MDHHLLQLFWRSLYWIVPPIHLDQQNSPDHLSISIAIIIIILKPTKRWHQRVFHLKSIIPMMIYNIITVSHQLLMKYYQVCMFGSIIFADRWIKWDFGQFIIVQWRSGWLVCVYLWIFCYRFLTKWSGKTASCLRTYLPGVLAV